MEKMYLQSVTRYTNNEIGVTGYEAIYSNGLDFEKVDFQIEDGQSIMNIPTMIKTPMTVGEIEELTKCEL